MYRLLLGLIIATASAPLVARDSIAVIYPDVPPPANRIFQEIIQGIESEHADSLLKKPIKSKESPEETLRWIERQQPDMLIALGKRSYRVAKRLYREKPVAIGALPIRPNGISGISLLADPKILFTALSELAPNISKVYVVYSPSTRWLIDIAQQQASAMQLELKNIEVKNIKDAVATYNELLANIDANNEAVWLSGDKLTTHEQVILPKLLEKSWEQNLVLFSSKPAHAKRGALFSVFPDNEALGQQLVTMVSEIHKSQQKAGVIPLQNMKLAVNLRTAAHLGFDYKSQQKEQFHLTFPQ